MAETKPMGTADRPGSKLPDDPRQALPRGVSDKMAAIDARTGEILEPPTPTQAELDAMISGEEVEPPPPEGETQEQRRKREEEKRKQREVKAAADQQAGYQTRNG
jgi:hypothetical protein